MKLYLCTLFVFLSIFTCKSQNYLYSWGYSFGDSTNDVIIGISVDKAGNCISAGRFSNQITLGRTNTVTLQAVGSVDFYILKNDPDGNVIWIKQFKMGGLSTPQHLETDQNGNIYILGRFDTTVDFDPSPVTDFNLTSSGKDIFILKLDSLGNFQFVKQIQTQYISYSTSLTIDKDENIFVYGTFNPTINYIGFPGFSMTTDGNGSDLFIFKMDSTGTLEWGNQYPSSVSFLFDLAITSMGEIICVGTFSDTIDFDPDLLVDSFMISEYKSAFIWKMNSQGNLIWKRIIGGNYYSTWAECVTLDNNDDIYIAGRFDSLQDFNPSPLDSFMMSGTFLAYEDIFIEKLDSGGNFIFAKKLALGSSGKIILDSKNNIVSTGFLYSGDFDPDTSSTHVFYLTGNDGMCYLSVLDSLGDFISAVNFGSATGSSSYFGLDSLDNFYVCGIFKDSADLDPDPGSYMPFYSQGNYDGFYFKLTNLINKNFEIDLDKDSYIYPNPVSNELTIHSREELRKVSIIDLTGQIIYENNNINNLYHVNVSDISSGMYLIQLTSSNRTSTHKFIKY